MISSSNTLRQMISKSAERVSGANLDWYLVDWTHFEHDWLRYQNSENGEKLQLV
jgi:hypothetical protein